MKTPQAGGGIPRTLCPAIPGGARLRIRTKHAAIMQMTIDIPRKPPAFSFSDAERFGFAEAASDDVAGTSVAVTAVGAASFGGCGGGGRGQEQGDAAGGELLMSHDVSERRHGPWHARHPGPLR